MITSLQTIAALDAEAVSYQVTGMAVVFACLILLSLILTASGAVAQRMDASRKAKAAAAKAAMAASNPPPSVSVAPAAAEMSPAQIAALAAGIYDTAKSSITPEVVACIAAAVKATVGNEARILDIRPSGAEYARSGRTMMMSSRFPVRDR